MNHVTDYVFKRIDMPEELVREGQGEQLFQQTLVQVREKAAVGVRRGRKLFPGASSLSDIRFISTPHPVHVLSYGCKKIKNVLLHRLLFRSVIVLAAFILRNPLRIFNQGRRACTDF